MLYIFPFVIIAPQNCVVCSATPCTFSAVSLGLTKRKWLFREQIKRHLQLMYSQFCWWSGIYHRQVNILSFFLAVLNKVIKRQKKQTFFVYEGLVLPGMRYCMLIVSSCSFSPRRQMAAPENKMADTSDKPTPVQARKKDQS